MSASRLKCLHTLFPVLLQSLKMSNPNVVEAATPITHVLDFLYDDEDACELTARINDVRFHISVHPYRLQSKSRNETPLLQEYKRRLRAVRDRHHSQAAAPGPAEASTPSQTSRSEGGDSGVDIKDVAAKPSPSKDSAVSLELESGDNKADDESNENDAEDHEIALQNWILPSFSDEVARLAPRRDSNSHLSLYDWYNTPAAFFELTVKDDQLMPDEVQETPQLRKPLDDMLPSLPMPKHIRSLPNLPMVDPHNITVLTELTHNPSTPIHPALVRAHLPDTAKPLELFFKPVDPTQPSPTKREISLLHKIHLLGLDQQINVPRLHALVSSPPKPGSSKSTSIMGILLTPIPTPATPLTEYLTPSSLSEAKRSTYAEECQRIISVLHAHDIVFGDSKADNFLVDRDGKLWIIDFGGSYTEGWVDAELEETKEGDRQGIDKIETGLLGNDAGDEDGDGKGADCGEDKVRQRGKKRSSSEEPEGDDKDAGRRQKRGRL